MLRLVPWGMIGVIAVASAACDRGHPAPAARTDVSGQSTATVSPAGDIGKPLEAAKVENVFGQGSTLPTALGPVDPIVVPNCPLTVVAKQEVPSQCEGVVVAVLVKEGDVVKPGQLVAQLEDKLAREDLAIKLGKILVSQAELAAAEKARDHFKAEHELLLKLHGGAVSAASQEEIRVAKLNYDRYFYEAESKRQAVEQAKLESDAARTVVAMHGIHSSSAGQVKAVYKRPGEAVKSYEPVLLLRSLGRMRAEGLIEKQYLPRLAEGMAVWIESAQELGPLQTLAGHLRDITAIAVGNDRGHPLIVSASADRTVLVWEQLDGRWHERQVLRHPAEVRALACFASPGASGPVCLSGSADGKLRLWDLNGRSDLPVCEFKDEHRGAVNFVAFSSDGRLSASGGDDREICLWDPAAGKLCYRFPAGHGGAVTWLQFAPRPYSSKLQLLSAGRDGTLRAWALGAKGAQLIDTVEHRSGDVTNLGVSADGRRVLFDQGRALRLLKLPNWSSDGVLQSPLGTTSFGPFALFSPDGQFILTAGASEGRLQLWQAPTALARGYEVRQLVPPDRAPATCAAFAPDGSFLVTGTREGKVLVWSGLPTRAEVEAVRLPGHVTLIERALEAGARQVRVWAEFDNPGNRLVSGATVNLVIEPAASHPSALSVGSH